MIFGIFSMDKYDATKIKYDTKMIRPLIQYTVEN